MGRRLQLLRIIPTSALAASNLKSVCLHGNFLERSSGGRSLERCFFSPEDLEKDFCPALLHSVLVCSISCDHRGLNLRGSAAAVSGYLSGNCGRDGRGGEDGSRSAGVCRLAGELIGDRGDTAEQAETHFLQDLLKL